MDTIKNKKYEPDGYDILINFIWNLLWFSVAIAGTFVLSTFKIYDTSFLSGLLFVLTAWLGIISAHISIRRFDKKYRDRLLNDPRAGLFIFMPFVFSQETLIKCRWQRWVVYFRSLNRLPTKKKLRKEIIPEFDFKRDVKFWDKFLFWGQPVFLLIACILGFWVKW